MRFLMLALLGGALMAQEAPPQSDKPEQPTQSPMFSKLPEGLKLKPQDEARKALMDLLSRRAAAQAVTQAPGRPCAIPLKNVLPQAPPQASAPQSPYVDSPARIKIFPPAAPGRFRMRSVPLPAPSCDDVKR